VVNVTTDLEWERTFAVDWWGVYYCARAFLPLLIASGNGVLVNTRRAHGMPGREDMSDEQAEETRDFLVTAKLVAQDAPPEEVRKTLAGRRAQ
jgi:NAD(P)-dependent dehydrogenase (short-subunit alcohol dehydrogenase family)